MFRLVSCCAAAMALCAQTPVALAQTTHPTVVHLPIVGAIEHGLHQQFSLAADVARSRGAEAIILDLDVPGGRFDAAQLAIGLLFESPVPVYAIVRGEASEAGALIALATDSVFMTPGSSIGGGPGDEGVKELSPSALRTLASDFRIVAVQRELDHRIAVAMIDAEIAIEGVVEAGERLTLSAQQAVDVGIAAGQVGDIADLLEIVGLDGAEIAPVGFERIFTGATISVTNRNWRDIRVFLVLGTGGSMRSRLGTVTSMNTADFEIPLESMMPGSLIRVVAEVIGSNERAQTSLVTVQPGLVIEWVIANMISQSNYFIYIRN